MTVLWYNKWNFETAVGDIMVETNGAVYRLEKSSGRSKRSAGVLYPRRIRKLGKLGTIEDGKLVWVDEEYFDGS